MNYRFKTEEEFKALYGDNWRAHIPEHWTSHMDFMLGMKISEEDYTKILIGELRYHSGWNIGKECVTSCEDEIDLDFNYEIEKPSIIPEIKQTQSLFLF